MAGTNVVNFLQLGDSATATQNFVWQTNVDGTAKLARGNVGATTQDILTVGSDGSIAMPQSVAAFSAYPSVAQAVSAGVATKVDFGTEEYDYGGFFNTATSRFQPTVAGVYSVKGGFIYVTNNSQGDAVIYKNGAAFKSGATSPSGANSPYVTADVYLNGSTDYVELWAIISVANTLSASARYTYFQAHLVAKA